MTDSTNKVRHFQLVLMPHLNAAFNLARWLTRSNQDAEDLVQDAYMRAFKSFDGFHGEDGRPWLLAIVRNSFYSNYLQRQRTHLHTSFDDELHEPAIDDAHHCEQDTDPESVLARRDDQNLINSALERLPVEFREILVLREFEDMSYKQIAEITGTPIGTVMSRLARGRKKLAELVKEGPL